jgi:hypothetical protein
VPAETRVALAAVARLENYKKDQVWHNSIQLLKAVCQQSGMMLAAVVTQQNIPDFGVMLIDSSLQCWPPHVISCVVPACCCSSSMTLVSKQATSTSSCLAALTSGHTHRAAAGAQQALTPTLLLQHKQLCTAPDRAFLSLLALVGYKGKHLTNSLLLSCACRPKSIVSVLRKGDTFGDQAIINRARHSTVASPGSNASLLVVSQEVSRCSGASMVLRVVYST